MRENYKKTSNWSKTVFSYLIAILIFSAGCTQLNKPDSFNEVEGTDLFYTANGNLEWISFDKFENRLGLYVGKDKADSNHRLFSCYTYVLGKLDSCIVFVHAVGLGCGYYPPGGPYTHGIKPQLDPTYYLLDFRSGENVLVGPLYYQDFQRMCRRRKVNPELVRDIYHFPLPTR